MFSNAGRSIARFFHGEDQTDYALMARAQDMLVDTVTKMVWEGKTNRAFGARMAGLSQGAFDRRLLQYGLEHFVPKQAPFLSKQGKDTSGSSAP